MNVEYRVLGPLEALVDGHAVALGRPRQRATLAVLLCQANTLVPVSRLGEDFPRVMSLLFSRSLTPRVRETVSGHAGRRLDVR